MERGPAGVWNKGMSGRIDTEEDERDFSLKR